MKNQLFLVTVLIGICVIPLTSLMESPNMVIKVPNKADFKEQTIKLSAPGISKTNKSQICTVHEVGDFEYDGEVYAIYGDGTGNISQIYFLGGPAVYSFSGYTYGHAGGTWANVTVYPSGPGSHFSYNGVLAFY